MTFSRLIRIARHRLRALASKDKLDSELSREFAFHLEQLIRENMANGMSREDARRAAHRTLGNIAVFEEDCRDTRRVGWLHDLWQDLRYGLRMLRNNPGFTLVAALSLALGIGANTAILSAIDAVMRGSLPYIDPDRLVMIRTFSFDNPSQTTNSTLPEYFAWKEQSSSFESMGTSIADQRDLEQGEDGTPAEHLVGRRITQELFPMLGIQPIAGRLFSESDYRLGQRVTVVLISHGLWQRRFGGDLSILNKQVRLGNVPLTVIGIMPPYFPYAPEVVDYWLPAALARPTENSARFFMVTARLKEGVTIEHAQAELDAVAAQLARDFPERNKGWGVRLQPLRDFLYGWVKPPLLTLEAAVAFVLLIACANVAGLLLARGSVRGPEIAMRIALGASRARIVRQLLTESVLLALLGGALGLIVARSGLSEIAAITPPPGAPRLAQVGITLSALGLTALTSVIVGIVFGVFPAFASVKPNVAGSLKGLQRAHTHSGGHRVREVLIAGQLAAAFMLLIGFGLMMKSFVLLAGRDFNFEPKGLLSFEFRIPQQLYMRDIGSYRDARYFEIRPNPSLTVQRVYETLRQVPGATSVAGSSHPPVNSLIVPTARVIPENRELPALEREAAAFRTSYFLVTPNFFPTLRAPIVRGRDFGEHDTLTAPWVAIINEAAARRFWPEEDPIGKRFTLDTVPDERPREVIGLVRDIPTRARQTIAEPVIYLSYLQQPSRYGPSAGMFGQMTFVMRASGDPVSLLPAARKAVAEIAPDRPLANISLVEGWVGALMADFSRYVVVLGTFALVATLLAAIGVYGVIAYSVAQRTREIAIRVTLGASAREIMSLAGRRAVLLISIGFVGGLAGSLALTRFIASQLWGVTRNDPATFAAVSVVLAIVALLACFIPVRRALRVDPTVALRSD